MSHSVGRCSPLCAERDLVTDIRENTESASKRCANAERCRRRRAVAIALLTHNAAALRHIGRSASGGVRAPSEANERVFRARERLAFAANVALSGHADDGLATAERAVPEVLIEALEADEANHRMP
jgi:hypothetical protein